MMKFRAVYRCVLCGELDDSYGFSCTPTKAMHLANEVLAKESAYLSESDGIGIHKETIHCCGGGNGNFGVGVFIGIVKDETEV